MAGIAAVLSAVARAQWRDLRSLQSIAGNNFFLFVLLLMQDPKSAAFFLLLIGALVLFPLSADPLRVAPHHRLALWPLSWKQLAAVRLGSLALSPAVWIVAILMARTARLRPALELAAVVACMQAGLFVSRQWTHRLPRWNVPRFVPAMPGVLGGLIRKDLRQMLCTLDFYIAGLLAAVGLGYRVFSAAPDPAAIPVLALVVVLAMSTYAQCLFGLDGEPGLMRYRLMPLRGWRILLTKDVAWLAALTPLIAGLSPLAGFTGAFAALTVGHHASVRRPSKQVRWRFTSGALIPVGLVQVIAMFAAGTAAERIGPRYLAMSVAAWAGSVLLYGFLWDRKPE